MQETCFLRPSAARVALVAALHFSSESPSSLVKSLRFPLSQREVGLFAENFFYPAAQRAVCSSSRSLLHAVRKDPQPAPAPQLGPVRTYKAHSAGTCTQLAAGFLSAVNNPSFFRLLFFSFQQIVRARTTSGPVKREKLREWSGNLSHDEHANGQPWYLQPVAAHGQGGHPQPALLHQLVTSP